MDTDVCVWLTMIDMTVINANGTSKYMGDKTHRTVKLRAKYVR